MSDTLAHLIDATSEFCIGRAVNEPLNGGSSISQDAYIFGVDVEDYVDILRSKSGPIVYEIPWLRFTDQTSSFRGCAVILVVPWLLWRCLLWPISGGKLIPKSDPRHFPHRLTLSHIAAVIDRGEWFEP